MAAFFALQIDQFPKDPNTGALALELDYVAKYLCKAFKSPLAREMPTLKSLTKLCYTSRNFRGHHSAIHRNRIQCQPIEPQYSRMVRPISSDTLWNLACFDYS